MPFQKGVSGNPGGRPKIIRPIEELARQHTDLAIATLAKICGDPKQPTAPRVTAAVALLDRGYGRPAQTIHATHKHEIDPEAVSDAQLATIAASVVPQREKEERDKMH